MADVGAENDLPQEVQLCDECGKIHIKGAECGSDLLDGDQFILEFEKLPTDEHIQKLRKTVQQLRDERWQATAQATKFRKKTIILSNGLGKVFEEVKKQKYSLSKLRADAEQNKKLLVTEYRTVENLVKKAVDHVSSLEKCDGSCVYIRQDFAKLQKEYEQLKITERTLSEQIVMLDVKLQEKSKESDTMQMFAKNRDITTDQKVSKLQKDFLQREGELKTLKTDYLVLQRRLEEEQDHTCVAMQQVQDITGECERLQTEHEKIDGEKKQCHVERLKLQSTIDELELQMKQLTAGIKDKVDKEMVKMMKDMDKYQGTLEKRQKEDLEKEKEKTRKELEEYILEYRQNQAKMGKSMTVQVDKYKETIIDLQKQLEQANLEADQREQLLQNQLKQLTSKSKQSDSRAGSRATQSKRLSVTPRGSKDLQAAIKDKDEVITSLTLETENLNDQVLELQAQLEIHSKDADKLEKLADLEVLVQNQIEERSDIMEAYNKLQEELAFLRQQLLRGSHQDPNHYTSMGPLFISPKKSVDKFSGFRPSETSGYDLSDLEQNAHKRMLNMSETRSDGKSLAAKSAKSSKSVKSLRSTHDSVGGKSGVKSSKSGRSIQDVIQVQMGGTKPAPSERTPYEIASKALARNNAVNNSNYRKDVDGRENIDRTVDNSTKYNSAKPPVPPISKKSAKSRSSGPVLEKGYSERRRNPSPPLKSSMEWHGADQDIANSPSAKVSGNDLLMTDKHNFRKINSIYDTYTKQGTERVGDRVEMPKDYITAKDARNESIQKLSAWANAPKQGVGVVENTSNVNRNKSKKHGNTQTVLQNKKNTVMQDQFENETKRLPDGVNVQNGKPPLPDIADRHVAFKDKYTPDQLQRSEYSWKAVIPPVSKNKINWEPNFETVNGGSVTPAGYGQSNHPLYNMANRTNHPLNNTSIESYSSMSNISTPSVPGPQRSKIKTNVDVPRSNMVKAMSEKKKGSSSEAAWKMYQRLKVGRL